LLAKAKNYENRIDFKDDIYPDHILKVYDITDLVKIFRDACCHVNSGKRKIGKNFGISFVFQKGIGQHIVTDEVKLECLYEDDKSYFMGGNKIYLKRHIERAYEEVKAFFQPLLIVRNR
jgi:hypothetical protein